MRRRNSRRRKWGFLAAFLAATALAPSVDAATPGGPTATQSVTKTTVDLAPTKIFFNRFCDLKAEICNQGSRPFGGQVGSRVLRNGQIISAGTLPLLLGPGATATVTLWPRALLGVWATEQNTWTWEVDYQHKVHESNEDNNSISVTLKCVKRPVPALTPPPASPRQPAVQQMSN